MHFDGHECMLDAAQVFALARRAGVQVEEGSEDVGACRLRAGAGPGHGVTVASNRGEPEREAQNQEILHGGAGALAAGGQGGSE